MQKKSVWDVRGRICICLLSPAVKIRLFRTYTCPILHSGLSSFLLRTTMLQPLTIFHRKTLRGILNLSKSSNIPAHHFLLGELPIKAKIHKDMFSHFYSDWKILIVKFSRLWNIYWRTLQKTVEPGQFTWDISLKVWTGWSLRMSKVGPPIQVWI